MLDIIRNLNQFLQIISHAYASQQTWEHRKELPPHFPQGRATLWPSADRSAALVRPLRAT